MSAAAFPNDLDARRLIETLGLAPHPEGGFYRETFRDGLQVAPGRAASTAIYFLLEAGRASAWHRIDATEIWLFHAGAPLLLSLSANGRTTTDQRLGSDILAGERPQAVVPAHYWQAARTLGAWTLVSCVVAPGFDFAKFELAPGDFAHGDFAHGDFAPCDLAPPAADASPRASSDERIIVGKANA